LRYTTAYGGGAPNYETASLFEADGNGSQRVDFGVVRGVHISGLVIDANSIFTPVSSVQIAALDLSGDRIATATSHDSTFDLVLAPGSYKLLAVDPLGRFYAMFYASAWTLATANTIAVSSSGAPLVQMTLIHITRRHPVRH
jgi:hypothetical protein